MSAETGTSAQQLLDQVQGLTQLEAFDVDRFTRRLHDELAGREPAAVADLEATDDRLRAALAAIDVFSGRCMRIRLDYLLAADTSVAPPFRKVLASTITGYDGKLELLRQRVASVAARLDPGRADETAATVVDAAAGALALRARLRDGLFGVTSQLASASLPAAQRAARDRSSPDDARQRWLVARRDLELLVARPQRIAEEAFARRLAALPAVEEEPEPTREPTRGELLELD